MNPLYMLCQALQSAKRNCVTMLVFAFYEKPLKVVPLSNEDW